MASLPTKYSAIHDVAASAVAVITVLGVLMLALLDKPIPNTLAAVQGASVSWLFIRSAVQTPS